MPNVPTRTIYDHNLGTSSIATQHENMLLKTKLSTISSELSFSGGVGNGTANNFSHGFCQVDSLIFDVNRATNPSYPNAVSIVPLISDRTSNGDPAAAPTTASFRVWGLSGVVDVENAGPICRIHRLLASVALTRNSSINGHKIVLEENGEEFNYFTFSHGLATASVPGISPIIYNGAASAGSVTTENPPMHFVVDLLDCTSVACTMQVGGGSSMWWGFAYNLF